MKNGVYPASPMSWLFVLTFVLAFILAGVDPSFGMIGWIKTHFPWYVLPGTKVKAGLKGYWYIVKHFYNKVPETDYFATL